MNKLQLELFKYKVDYKLYDENHLIYADSLAYDIDGDKNDKYNEIIELAKRDVLFIIDSFIKKDKFRRTLAQCKIEIVNVYKKINDTGSTHYYNDIEKTTNVVFELFDENGCFITVSDILLKKIAGEYYQGNISFKSIIDKYGVNSEHITDAIHKYSDFAKALIAANDVTNTIFNAVSNFYTIDINKLKTIISEDIKLLRYDDLLIYYKMLYVFKEYTLYKHDIINYFDSCDNLEIDNLEKNYKDISFVKQFLETNYTFIIDDIHGECKTIISIIKSYGRK